MEMEQGNLGVEGTQSGEGVEDRLSFQHPCNFCRASFTSELGLICHFRGEHYFNREGKVDDPFLSSDESDEDEAGVTTSIKRKLGGGILGSGGDEGELEEEGPAWDELDFLTDCERAHLTAEPAFDPYPEEDDEDDDLDADSEPEAEISWELIVGPDHEDYDFWRGLPNTEKNGGEASHGEAELPDQPLSPPSSTLIFTTNTSTPGGRPQIRLRSLPPERGAPPTSKTKKVTKAKKDEDKVKSKGIAAPAKAKTPVPVKNRRGRPPTKDGGGRQFDCIFCGKTYVQGQEYLFHAHLRSHTMERPYFCKLCDQSFALNNYLTKHIRKWHDDAGATPYPYKSKVCPESLSTRGELPNKEAKSKSTNDKVPLSKPSSTSTPGGRRQFALRLLPSLQSPGKVETSPTPTEKVTTRAKKDEDQVKSKVITDPPRTTPVKGPRGRGNDPRFECIFCGKTYSREWPFHAHLRTHTMESPYFCKLCDASFGRADYLTNHVRNKHKTVKTLYKCQLCSFTFRTREKLRRHHSVVHVKPDSDFKCEYCDKRFATGQNKARHRRVHFKEMKRKCPHCPKEFDRSDNLQNHMRSFHNSGMPLICRHCREEFPSRSALGIHKRLMHSSEPSKNKSKKHSEQ